MEFYNARILFDTATIVVGTSIIKKISENRAENNNNSTL